MRLSRFWLTSLMTLGLAMTAGSVHAGPGPIGTYYGTQFSDASGNTSLIAIQGSSYVANVAAFTMQEGPIAVFPDSGAIRTTGYQLGDSGGQYFSSPSLNVSWDGTTYKNTFAPSGFTYDGTTDGTRNYTVDYISGDVITTDTSWGGAPTTLFNVGVHYMLGITYDFSNNSLWMQNYSTGQILDFSLTGNLLASFFVQSSANGYAALAMDVDHTLWYENYGTGVLQHYATDGTYLGSADYSADGMAYVLGAEIAPPINGVPEPSTVLAAGFGVLTIGALVRRRRAAR